jgi:hypothetical protein
MFVLLPVFALLLHVLHRRARRVYLEHFVFALHLHTTTFVIATIRILLAPLTTSPSALRGPAVVIDSAVQLYIVVYLYAALRVFYGGGRLATVVKMVALLAGYIAALLLALFGFIRALKFL